MIVLDSLRSLTFSKTIHCMVIKNILFLSFFENPYVKNVSQFWLLFNSLQLFDFSFMLTFKVEKGEL